MSHILQKKISFWCETLDLNYSIRVDRWDPGYVTGENVEETGFPIVGVRRESENTATIVASRRIREDDIVHELLHLRYPDWDHESIVRETESLLVTRNAQYVGVERT